VPRSAAFVGVYMRAGSSNGLPNVQPAKAAETPGVPIKSTKGSTPRAWNITGLHQRVANAVPAAPNPRAADTRGHRIKTKETRCIVLFCVHPLEGRMSSRSCEPNQSYNPRCSPSQGHRRKPR
jgi:ribosomal protein S30